MQSPKRLFAVLTPLAIAVAVSFGTEVPPSPGPVAPVVDATARSCRPPPNGERLSFDELLQLPLSLEGPSADAPVIGVDVSRRQDTIDLPGGITLFQMQVGPDGAIGAGAGESAPDAFWLPNAERSGGRRGGLRGDLTVRVGGLPPRDSTTGLGDLDPDHRSPVRSEWSYSEQWGYRVAGQGLLQLGDGKERAPADLEHLLANMNVEALTEHALTGSATMMFSALTDLSLFVDYRLGNDRDPFALEFFVQTRF